MKKNEPPPDFGRLETVYGISPAFMQRAAFVAVLSFVFFVVMLVAFSIRQNIGYFLLATAFLLVQLLTLFGWLVQRRTEFKIYENGFSYKKQSCRWDEIESMAVKTESRLVGGAKVNCEIRKNGGEKIVLNEALHGVDKIMERISAEIEKRSE
ncbi:MAG TPA: DUF6585 family protein [Pyrinomonadaceae bacterium]